MNNNFPPGQASQSPSSINNGTAVYGPARNSMMYHNNRTQFQTANYSQPQPQRVPVPLGHPQMPPHHHIASPFGGQQPIQPSPPPGSFVNSHTVVGRATGFSPYSHAVHLAHTAASPHDHPAPKPSPLEHDIVSPNNMAAQPHSGALFYNNGMNSPAFATNWGGSLPHSIPTAQAPSTAGIPAYDFGIAQSPRDRIRRRPQARRAHVLSGQTQQGPAKRTKVEQEFEEHGANGHGLIQPGANAPRANTNPAFSYPLPGQDHLEFDAPTAEFLKTANPLDYQFGPGDILDQVCAEQALTRPRTRQAVFNGLDLLGDRCIGELADTFGCSPWDLCSILLKPTTPFTEEEISHYSSLYHAFLRGPHH